MLNRFIKCIWIEPGKGTVVYRVPLPEDAKRPHATELVLALEEPVPPTVRVAPHEWGSTGLHVKPLDSTEVHPSQAGVDPGICLTLLKRRRRPCTGGG